MDLELEGARVIVTGGASNIGRGIVHGFAEQRGRIAICDIDTDQAEKVRLEALERGAQDVAVISGDLTKAGSGDRIVSTVIERWGGIDALVNNAGWSAGEFFIRDTDRQRWNKTVEVNLYTAIEVTQAVLGPMVEAEHGSIVFISSDAAQGEIRQGIYGMTKAGLIALCRTIAKEHGRHGIRSNAVCSGLVVPAGADAVGVSSLWGDDPDSVFNDKQIEGMKRRTPLGRLTLASDIADAVMFLCSSRARQITGQAISVNGGYAMV